MTLVVSRITMLIVCMVPFTCTKIGHVLGCYHDRIADSSIAVSNPTYLGFGSCWEDTSKTDCTGYSSVMFYDCKSVPNSCTSCRVKII